MEKELMEMEGKFNKLKEEGKIIVEVKQNGKVANYWLDEKTNIVQLMGFLYQKAIQKNNNLKIRYSYNYSDLQTITFSSTYYNYDDSKTITSYKFYNIPTNLD